MKTVFHGFTCTPRGERGGSNTACMAVIFILIIGGIGGYFYLQHQGFSLAGSSVMTVKSTTATQKEDYLRQFKKQFQAIHSISSLIDGMIRGIRTGSLKTQMDVNKRAADIENRMGASLLGLQRMKVPVEFVAGHKEFMRCFKSYRDCLHKARRINNSLTAENMEQIDQNIQEIDRLYQQGVSHITTGMGMIRKTQGDLRLKRIL